MVYTLRCLHLTLNIEPLYEFIYRLSEKFFHQCSIHQNPLVRQIGDYTIAENTSTSALYISYCNYTQWLQCFFFTVL
jgi:hypothetical protein